MVELFKIGPYNFAVISKVLGILEENAPLGSGRWDFSGAHDTDIARLFERWRQVRADTARGRKAREARERRRKEQPR